MDVDQLVIKFECAGQSLISWKIAFWESRSDNEIEVVNCCGKNLLLQFMYSHYMTDDEEVL